MPLRANHRDRRLPGPLSTGSACAQWWRCPPPSGGQAPPSPPRRHDAQAARGHQRTHRLRVTGAQPCCFSCCGDGVDGPTAATGNSTVDTRTHPAPTSRAVVGVVGGGSACPCPLAGVGRTWGAPPTGTQAALGMGGGRNRRADGKRRDGGVPPPERQARPDGSGRWRPTRRQSPLSTVGPPHPPPPPPPARWTAGLREPSFCRAVGGGAAANHSAGARTAAAPPG